MIDRVEMLSLFFEVRENVSKSKKKKKKKND